MSREVLLECDKTGRKWQFSVTFSILYGRKLDLSTSKVLSKVTRDNT